MGSAREERVALFAITARTDPSAQPSFVARVTQTSDVTAHDQRVWVTSDPADLLAALREWLETTSARA